MNNFNKFDNNFNYNLRYQIDNLGNSGFQNIDNLELKNRVIACHSTYLQLEKSSQKLELKLESLVIEYLSNVTHKNKLTFLGVLNCLDKSIYENQNFNAYQAVEAFEALNKIASNLIIKPWRKEFHVICPYNGVFKYLIEAQIKNYHEILKLLGYELKESNGIKKYLFNKQNNFDYWLLVSLDCFICSVELKIFIQIYEILRCKKYKPSWVEILKLRSKFSGGIEYFVNTYIDLVKEINLSSNLRMIALDNTNFNKENQNINYKNVTKINNIDKNLIDFDMLSNQNSNDDMLYFYPKTYENSNIANNNSCSQYSQKNDKIYSKYNEPLSNFSQSVDLHEINNTTLMDEVDNRKKNSDMEFKQKLQCEGNHINNIESRKEIQSTIKYLDSNVQKLELAMKSNDEKLNLSQNFKPYKGNDKKAGSLEKKKHVLNLKYDYEKKFSTLGMKEKSEKSFPIKKSLSNSNTKSISIESKWSCKHCTYLNYSTDEICKMCSRTKDKEEFNLISGGRECSVCTLVNDKNELNCLACNSSLKDSPTYI